MFLFALTACRPTDDGPPPVGSDGTTAGSTGHTGAPTPPVHTAHSGTPTPVPPNVVMVILDDVGVDKIAAYGVWPGQPSTPTFDRLAGEGVLFRHAYASPTCSPSRAALFTGRHGRRTGLGGWIEGNTDSFSLSETEITIPTVLAAAPIPYASALVGKWHLVSYDRPDPASHPAALGFPDFTGTLGNLGLPVVFSNGRNYFRWEKVVHGALTSTTTYATTDVVDEAIGRLSDLPEPFFLTVSLHAAHVPIHVPPAELLDAPVADTDPDVVKYTAMVAAADRELGRLVDAFTPDLRARTTLIVFGDNGTDRDFVLPPFDPLRRKSTVFDGGVRVPFVVTGPPITRPGTVSDALISIVDVLPTLAALAGVEDLAAADPHALDGASFLPVLADPTEPGPRTFVYAEEFEPNGPPPYPAATDVRMVRDATHKLIRDGLGAEGLYRYDPGALDEGPDLLAAGPLGPGDDAALVRLRAELDRQVASLVYEGP